MLRHDDKIRLTPAEKAVHDTLPGASSGNPKTVAAYNADLQASAQMWDEADSPETRLAAAVARALLLDNEPAAPAESPLSPVTLWFRLDDRKEWDFNHLEDGHFQGERPAPKTDVHKRAWGAGQWMKVLAHLTDDVPAKVVRGESLDPA